jgi:DNA-binding winged helix-turn-helix (wHTH) protein/Tol biopolymer transport system component
MPENRPSDSSVEYHFGPYRFDARLRRLYKDEELVVLTPKAADTLAVLVERAGRVVEKDELLRAVWDDVVVGDDTLAQNISTLRRVFADDPSRPLFIATAPRRGYRFVAPVRTGSPDTRPPEPGVPRVEAERPVNNTTRWLIGLAATAVLAAALGGFVAGWFSAGDPPRAPVHFAIPEPEAGRFSPSGGMLALSPDGRHLSFVVVDQAGTSTLWLRPLTSATARRLAGTEGAAQPFWSPDSRTVAFFAGRRLNAVDVATGAVRVVASLESARSTGGSWSPQGQIMFSVPNDGMYLVASSGGTPEQLAPALDERCEGCAAWPHFLPDGRRFLYTVMSSDRPGIYVGEIGKPGGERVIDAGSSSTYVASGLLTYARSGTLYVQPFDANRLRVTGSPVPVADGVAHNVRTGRVLAAVSEAGVLAFRGPPVTELVWVDRTGTPQTIAAPPGAYLDFSIAPDGERVAAARIDPRTGTSDIWVLADGREARVTDDADWDGAPIWSHDGAHVIYSSRRGGRWRIHRRQATSVSSEERLLDTDDPVLPLQALPPARVVYSSRRISPPFDLWQLDPGGASPLASLGGLYPGDAQLSPDERWLAYCMPEAGEGPWSHTLYVSGPPPFGEARRAIAGDACSPHWRADGRELFYLSSDLSVVAVPVDPRGTPADSPGELLFRVPSVAPTGISGQVYDVAPDGSRFLVKREAGGPSVIHLVLNWDAQLARN